MRQPVVERRGGALRSPTPMRVAMDAARMGRLRTQGRSWPSIAAQLGDRYVFVDGKACYQSGASFKDGAKLTPTTLTQITDADLLDFRLISI